MTLLYKLSTCELVSTMFLLVLHHFATKFHHNVVWCELSRFLPSLSWTIPLNLVCSFTLASLFVTAAYDDRMIYIMKYGNPRETNFICVIRKLAHIFFLLWIVDAHFDLKLYFRRLHWKTTHNLFHKFSRCFAFFSVCVCRAEIKSHLHLISMEASFRCWQTQEQKKEELIVSKLVCRMDFLWVLQMSYKRLTFELNIWLISVALLIYRFSIVKLYTIATHACM